MRRILIILIAAVVAVACTDRHDGTATPREPQPGDTLYTQESAMNIYAYQPVRALQLVDSAVIVGNISPWKADVLRTRIYTATQRFDQMDSLLG